MAVDKGGLRYPLELADEFSGPAQTFIRVMGEMGTAWDQFRATVRRSANVGTRIVTEAERAARASQQVAEAGEKEAATSRRKKTALSAEERERRRLIRAIEKQKAIESLQQKEPTLFPQKQAAKATFEKAEALSFEEKVQTRLAKAIEERAIKEKVAELAAARGIKLTREKAAALSAEEREERRLTRAKEKREAIERLQQRRPDLFPATAAGGRAGAGAFDAPVPLTQQEKVQTQFQRSLQALQTRAQILELQKASPEFQKAKKHLDDLTGATERASRTGNSLFFTFRRLVGVFAAFAVIRGVVSGFQAVVSGAITFNAAIERSRQGIAALILASSEIRNEQGQVVTGMEAFAIAQGIAAQQLSKLRAESLKTAASFDELAVAFQVAIAPGRAAGLNLDQIRQLAVQVSQAATALGIEQNQLSEEIRSILTGTITPRTTRLSVLPGLTNEAIRDAREAGRLFEFLNDRLKAFSIASEGAAKTFDVLFSNLKEAFQFTLAQASEPLFEQLKALANEITGILLVADDLNGLRPSPAVVEAFKGVADGLSVVIEEARASLRSLVGEDLRDLGPAIGSSLASAGVFLVKLSEAAIRLAGVASTILSPVLDVVVVVLRNIQLQANAVFEALSSVNGLWRSMKDAILTNAVQPLEILSSALKTTADDWRAYSSVLADVLDKAASFTQGLADLGKKSGAALKASVGAGGFQSASDRPGGTATPLAPAEDPQQAKDRQGIEQRVKLLQIERDALIANNRIRRELLTIQEQTLDGQRTERDLEIAKAQAAADSARAELAALFQKQGLDQQKLRQEIAAEFSTQKRALLEQQLVTLQEQQAQALAEQSIKVQELENGYRRLKTGIEESVRAVALNLARGREELAQLQIQLAQARVSAGQGEQIQVIRAERELLRLKKERVQLENQEKVAKLASLELQLKSKELGAEERKAVEARRDALKEELELSRKKLEIEGKILDLRAEQASASASSAGAGYGDSFGEAWGNHAAARFADALEQSAGQIDQALLQQLIVDPDDQSQILNSFQDLLDNIKRLFKENPLGFLLSIFGAQGFFPGQQQQAPGVGFARGGFAPRRAVPSIHHLNARGFARGGFPRPRGLDPRDTVPVWVRPGEPILRPETRSLYGDRFLGALNDGLLDPAPLRAMASGAPALRAPASPGFAGGGIAPASGGSGEPSGPVQAFLVPNETMLQALLTAGKGAMYQFFRDEGPNLRPLMGGG